MIGIDIKMPKDCAHCPMDQDTYGGGYCLLTNTSTNAVRFVRRSDNCPFVTINDHPDENKVTNCNHNADPSKMVPSSWPHENGKDIIYRQDAIDALNEYFARIGKLKRRGLTEGEKAISLDTVGTIKTLPSAQPEIIHCRECKHWREGDAYSYCDKLFSMGVLDVYDYMTSEDDFCSNAERRTDAETEV